MIQFVKKKFVWEANTKQFIHEKLIMVIISVGVITVFSPLDFPVFSVFYTEHLSPI